MNVGNNLLCDLMRLLGKNIQRISFYLFGHRGENMPIKLLFFLLPQKRVLININQLPLHPLIEK